MRHQHIMNLYLTLLILLLSACSTVPSVERRSAAAKLLFSETEWQQQLISTSAFDLMSVTPRNITQHPKLTVYIEGDGLAWITSRKPSANPTPVNPVGLKLALNHQTGNAAYLARPCQYVVDTTCNTRHWTSHRFAPDVIDASNQAIDKLKKQFSAQQLVLVGYSGGGAVAAILAAQRDDVVTLVTVAGNLDHKAWTKFHHISPLTGSLNPLNFRKQLAKTEQVHFVGEDDAVIPPFLLYDFVASLPAPDSAKVIVVTEQSHSCCWESVWQNGLLDDVL